ncbi:MAG: DUF1592 domain-containing protein, partial [Gammaproteobacteria bacterium]|nr:DUF1592 domain-containing protein [Gammaproteobacteria bacterium]
MKRIVAVTVLAVACLSDGLTHADKITPVVQQDADANILQPAFQQRCVKCHGKNGKAKGKVNLFELKSVDDLAAKPALVRDLIDALDSEYMPPENEPSLSQERRERLVARLRELLRIGVGSRKESPRAPIRRMNRFQYNNAVQDLFQLDVVVFPLPERMLREHGNYFQPQTGKMPAQLRAGSRPLGKSQLIERRLAGVTPFPQDLRAEHGFDNRGDHLSLSPLLLESFLKLSRSIVESPDFNPRTCGIWPALLAPPTKKGGGADIESVVRHRLRSFLTRAFRRPVEDKLLDRYAGYVLTQIGNGESFSDSMKAGAGAAIASPRFFYLYDQVGAKTDEGTARLDDFDLASRLSFFLWGSIPDQPLLDAAAQGRLHEPDVLTEQVERMLRDKRLKRFCDSFPAQWLQLERIISSTPDPQRYPQFYFGKYRASMHMMLEPLLLFETVLIEDHSILKFIDSDFSYRSDLLQAWYRDGSQGKPGSPVSVQFRRVPVTDRRQGGVITNAAVMTMTSSATRTKPITRGAWIASVILNDPPELPPANVPPLADVPGTDEKNMTLRERFAEHRQRADCAGCHQRIDPLGFALENYDAAGIWRDTYESGRTVDASGTLFGRHKFNDVVEFKDALLMERDRFTRALASHLLSFALGREVGVEESLVLDHIVQETAAADYRFQALIK